MFESVVSCTVGVSVCVHVYAKHIVCVHMGNVWLVLGNIPVLLLHQGIEFLPVTLLRISSGKPHTSKKLGKVVTYTNNCEKI